MALNSHSWSKAELSRLRSSYVETPMSELVGAMPGRSPAAIRRMASTAGVARKRQRWTQEEDATIWRVYPSQGSAAAARLLPLRTIHAVRRRAVTLGIAAESDVAYFWRESEDDIIRGHYPDIGAVGVAGMLKNRSPAAIRQRARFVGVKKK